jgi:hypothetical protein
MQMGPNPSLNSDRLRQTAQGWSEVPCTLFRFSLALPARAVGVRSNVGPTQAE